MARKLRVWTNGSLMLHERVLPYLARGHSVSSARPRNL
jgi:hypothetical protein